MEDHCIAIEKVINNAKAGDTYLIGGQETETNNLEVARQILKALKKPESLLEFVKDRPGHDRKYAVDWSKAKKELKWQPKRNFNERLADTVQWYDNNRWYWEKQKKEVESFYEKIKR